MRICFVANEVHGAHQNGGIGTATTHLMLEAAAAGHEVELLYTGDTPFPSQGVWPERFRKTGITVREPLYTAYRISPHVQDTPFRVFASLRETRYDKILFQDWMAPGFACFIAKHTGGAFLNTILAVICHSSTEWLNEANGYFPPDPDTFRLIHMERECVRLADEVLSPSAYMLSWMKERWGNIVPEASRVVPLLIPPRDGKPRRELRGNPGLAVDGPGSVIDEIVFFGRLEERKGIRVMIEALNSLEPRLFHNRRLTFLGRVVHLGPEQIRSALRQEVRDAFREIRFLTDHGSNEALAHISRPGVLAIMPSLIDNSPCVIYECLNERVKFLASHVGGIPELIAEKDRPRVLFAPNKGALAKRLAAALARDDFEPVAPAPRLARSHIEWREWFESPVIAERLTANQPKVTVIVVHHDRPRFLQQLLASLDAQDYANFDVTVVDDGSISAEAVSALKRLETQPRSYPLRVLRQANKYLGAARNYGVQNSQSDYVIFFDDDNLALPHTISRLVKAASHSGADIVTGMMRYFYSDKYPPMKMDYSNDCFAFPGGPLALGMMFNIFGDATALYRRNVFDSVQFHEIYGVTHEDWAFHANAALKGFRIISLQEPILWYRVTPDSMIRNTRYYSNMQEVFQIYRNLLPAGLNELPMLAFSLAQFAQRAPELQMLQERIRGFETSTSWRVSAPVRAVGRLVLLLRNRKRPGKPAPPRPAFPQLGRRGWIGRFFKTGESQANS